MNFFGHAVVAQRYCARSGFILGAMLPDFAGMLRQRPPLAQNADITSGVAFHHRTDGVFHACKTFSKLSAEALDWLLRSGLARGSARAVAHVGVEILLDSALVQQPGARKAYREALEAADIERLGSSIEWLDERTRFEFEKLRCVLLQRAVDDSQFGSSATPFVAFRLERAMAARPRLAINAGGRAIIESWIDRARDEIFALSADLLAEVHQGLAAAASGFPPLSGLGSASESARMP
jgi:hypothetical protein